MAKNKTQFTEAPVLTFLEEFATGSQQHADSLTLLKEFQRISGEPGKMWGPSIVGFGSYQYTYASGHSGEAPILGFSPRKTAISLYLYCDTIVSPKEN